MKVESSEIIRALEKKKSFYNGKSNTDYLTRWGLVVAIDVVKDHVKAHERKYEDDLK